MDVHGIPVGFYTPPALHGGNVSSGDCASVGVFLESSNTRVDGSHSVIQNRWVSAEVIGVSALMVPLAFPFQYELDPCRLALVLLHLELD